MLRVMLDFEVHAMVAEAEGFLARGHLEVDAEFAAAVGVAEAGGLHGANGSGGEVEVHDHSVVDIEVIDLGDEPASGVGADFADLAAEVADAIDEVGGLLGELAAGLLATSPPIRGWKFATPRGIDEDRRVAGEVLFGLEDVLAVAVHVAHADDIACLLEAIVEAAGGGEIESDRLFNEETFDVFGASDFDIAVEVGWEADVDGVELLFA